MIAQLPNVPWSVTGHWFIGLIGVLAVCVLVLSLINQWNKAFGKRPPVDDQLREVHEKIRKGDAALHARMDGMRREVDQRFIDLGIDRQRTLDALYEKGINPIRDAVNRILGMLEERDRS